MARLTKTIHREEEKDDDYLHCTCCGDLKTNNSFYKSYAFTYKGIGKLTICKDCIVEIYNKYLEKYKDDIKLAIYYTCMEINAPYSRASYLAVLKEITDNPKKNNVIGIYMTKVNSIGRFNGAGSDFMTGEKLDEDEQKESIPKEETVINNELIRKWGKGYSEEDLQFLEYDYAEWAKTSDCDKIQVSKLVRMICKKELDIEKAREDGDNTEKLEQGLLKIMDATSLTPKTTSALNESDSAKVYGIWLKDIETYRPAEYFQDKSIYKDFDSLLDYLNRFVFRPLKNLLTGSREFDKEFNVEDIKEDGDDNGKS